jgi:hypothetical protein
MTSKDIAVRLLLRTALQVMEAAILRASRCCSGLDKAFNLALELCDTLFQAEHVLAARIVHAEDLGPVIQVVAKAPEHRCALPWLMIAVIASP